MPVLDRFLWVDLEMAFFRRGFGNRAPAGFRTEHQVDALRGRRQLGVDDRGKRMDQVRPARIPQPEMAAAAPAEMPHRRARPAVDGRLVECECRPPFVQTPPYS